MIKPIKTLTFPGSTDNYSFIPVEPTETDRGGIIASTTVDENYELEVKVKDDGKAYVPHDENKLDSQLTPDDAGKTMKVDAEGNIVPVREVTGIGSRYEADTQTLVLCNPGTSEIMVDSSLQTIGKAADAKSTGEEIKALKARVLELEEFLSSLVDASKELY